MYLSDDRNNSDAHEPMKQRLFIAHERPPDLA